MGGILFLRYVQRTISDGLMNIAECSKSISKDVYNERNIRLVPIWETLSTTREEVRNSRYRCLHPTKTLDLKSAWLKAVMLVTRAKSSSRFSNVGFEFY